MWWEAPGRSELKWHEDWSAKRQKGWITRLTRLIQMSDSPLSCLGVGWCQPVSLISHRVCLEGSCLHPSAQPANVVQMFSWKNKNLAPFAYASCSLPATSCNDKSHKCSNNKGFWVGQTVLNLHQITLTLHYLGLFSFRLGLYKHLYFHQRWKRGPVFAQVQLFNANFLQWQFLLFSDYCAVGSDVHQFYTSLTAETKIFMHFSIANIDRTILKWG